MRVFIPLLDFTLYTDFCTKNIFVHPSTSEVLLIDLDSALSYENLSDDNILREAINHFDNKLWSMWLHFVLPRQGKDASPEVLRRSMVFSLAAVWGRALGLLKGPQPPPEDPFRLIEEPLLSKQEPLWEALQTGSEAKFQEYFRLSQPVNGLFELWQRNFRELSEGRHAIKDDVRQAADLIARANMIIPTKKQTPPDISPKSKWEPPQISLRTMGKNIYDPFRIFTLTSKLIRSRSKH